MAAVAAVNEPASETLAVVVVAHSSGALLIECARRVLAAIGVTELVVVDNASNDGSIDKLCNMLGADARLRVLRNRDNPGFARACNQGAAISDASWLAFLNPDCLIEPDALHRLLAVARALQTPGVIGADVRDAEGRPEAAARRRDPTPWRAAMSLSGIARFASSRNDAWSGVDAKAPVPDGAATPVDAISGALMLIPRVAFDRLGGFDEGYRLHAEDLDLCRRARELGLNVAVAEGVRVTHLKGTSSARRPLFVAFHKHRGMWRYFSKFDGARAGRSTRALVWLAIWTRFAVLAPWLALRQWMFSARDAGGAA